MDVSRISLLTALLITLVTCEVDVPVTEHWFGGFQAGACITVTKELNGWRAHLKFSEEVHSIEIYVALSTKISSHEYLLENQPFNSHIAAGDQFCFTFIGHVTGAIVPKVTIYFEGVDGPAGSGTSRNSQIRAAPASSTGGEAAAKSAN